MAVKYGRRLEKNHLSFANSIGKCNPLLLKIDLNQAVYREAVTTTSPGLRAKRATLGSQSMTYQPQRGCVTEAVSVMV